MAGTMDVVFLSSVQAPMTPITENKMSLAKLYLLSDNQFYNPVNMTTNEIKELIKIAMFASEPIPFDPMEVALHETYTLLNTTDERPNYKMVYEYPLSGKPPMMTHVFEDNKKNRIIAAKGAPEAFLNICNLSFIQQQQITNALNALAKEGYRILAIATTTFAGNDFPKTQQVLNFSFKGLVAFYDPPKKNIHAVLENFYNAGISVKIITGDNAATTTSIAKQVGFKNYDKNISGDELMTLDAPQLKELVISTNIFTRMFPDAKMKIINALKAKKEIVAMTGDGVNDGPALKAAHIGIAMGKRGTEIAKGAAALILVEDDLSKMVEAIAMGRRIYTNLKKAIRYGLSEAKALEALTKTPATMLGVYDQVGSLDAGKWANFIITTEPVFSSNSKIVENWIQGNKYEINPNEWNNYAGKYSLVVNNNGATTNYALEVKKDLSATIIGTDTLTAKITIADAIIKMSFPEKKGRMAETIRLGGAVVGNSWSGLGLDAKGNKVSWTANFVGPMVTETKKTSDSVNNSVKLISKVTYPFAGLGNEVIPQQETILIKNATVWTNEKEGKVANTDVLLKAGKIAKIGKDITEAGARVIDGTGKHLTPGIIDEHSHIAAMSINEGAQSVTSEVRVGDNMNPEDINIYRQLSGGVTSSHILHGSANTIGGQTQLIKLRWGTTDEGLKFAGADPFIKFALGENVKRTTSTNNNRFPDTRMGVEEVLTDAFDKAVDYQKAMKANPTTTRRDLELEALTEIMNKKRFITCHSYVQTEITYAMRAVEKFKAQGYDFNINTFTHILDGYKVADKMKVHGASAATFSDWFAYKTEVTDAIAYNAAIMHNVGVNTVINSDDAEMARRLNQEAGKAVKYGGVSEEEALKMVTLNPAKALHVDNKVGSIKVGKDADVVLWSEHPLSIYAKSLYTIVDGTVYFDREKDAERSKQVTAERTKLIQKMLGDKRAGMPTRPATPTTQILLECGDHDHNEGLNTIYESQKN